MQRHGQMTLDRTGGHLCSLMTEDAGCKREIKARLGNGHMVNAATKKSGKAIAWSLVLCGYESWTIKKSSRGRINALEM